MLNNVDNISFLFYKTSSKSLKYRFLLSTIQLSCSEWIKSKNPADFSTGSSSLGYKDSNLEMTESESVALPFGDSPIHITLLLYTINMCFASIYFKKKLDKITLFLCNLYKQYYLKWSFCTANPNRGSNSYFFQILLSFL